MRGYVGGVRGCRLSVWVAMVLTLLGEVSSVLAEQPQDAKAKALLAELKACKYKIIYETYRENNWEIFRVDADGANPVNLTGTPDINEMYPHASPDGTKICFVADVKEGGSTSRNVYTMNIDGTGRKLAVRNGRDPCWNHDGSAIVCLGGEISQPDGKTYASRTIVFYDLKTGQFREHPNKALEGLYAICCSADGNWILSSVHGAMGFSHAIVAIQANGTGLVDLKLLGCRPDVSPDGKKVANGSTDFSVTQSDLDLTGPKPKAKRQRSIMTSTRPNWVYHADWSPDGHYVVFSRGPKGERKSLRNQAPEAVGSLAPGWNICVADATQKNRWVAITFDGNSNKEPDWVPLPAEKK
jgi:Tol biopolymer transport system component